MVVTTVGGLYDWLTVCTSMYRVGYGRNISCGSTEEQSVQLSVVPIWGLAWLHGLSRQKASRTSARATIQLTRCSANLPVLGYG